MNPRIEIAELAADYWLRVDQRVADPADELYVNDGVFQAGTLVLEGRAAIRAFFTRRNREQEAAGRRTRHLQLNQHVTAAGPDQAICRSTVVVFAGVGVLPIQTGTASTVADAEDLLIRVPGLGWRYRRRTLTSIFTGPGAAAFAQAGAPKHPIQHAERPKEP